MQWQACFSLRALWRSSYAYIIIAIRSANICLLQLLFGRGAVSLSRVEIR